MAKLRAISGPLAGQTYEVESELVIGRQDTDVTIDDLELSRRHAVVRRHANRLQVEDLGSSNGTFVDGTRIEEPTLLGGGAEIRIGATVLVVEGVLPVQSGDASGTDAEGVTSDVEGLDPDLARRVTAVRTVPPPPPPKETAAPTAAAASVPAGAAPAGAAPAGAAPVAPSAPPPASAAPPRGAPRPQTPSGPVGEFRPPRHTRSTGLATRSWVPVALSFGTVILVAIALVLYFALAK